MGEAAFHGEHRRRIVAGIDEAGFGPLLGPLVIGATAWHVPDDDCRDGTLLWQRLRGGVTRMPSRRLARLAINDSKKIYSPQKGLLDLERGVLGTLAVQRPPGRDPAPAPAGAAGSEPPGDAEPGALCFGRFLDRLAPGWAEQAAEHPWYAGCETLALPVVSDLADLATRSNGLRVAMNRAGIEFLGAGLEVVLESRFNQLSDTIRNKSRMLFCLTARLIQRLFARFGGDRLTIMCDKQGGRDSYRSLLLEHWPELNLAVLVESGERSGYELTSSDGTRAMQIWFQPGADLKCLPAALASMYCKYTREVFMQLLNRFWREHVGGDLRTTAGYYGDGRRFIKDVAEAAGRLGLPPERFIRQR